ncbi:hypothetical protein PspLS_01311 [Pyricularia sp. CBS 133598]|nr:hypothetical protein PspLS_01311 [Pyricularia sp. CBS 133598]
MFGQYFIIYPLLIFSLQYGVTAHGDSKLDSDKPSVVVAFGFGYSPNFLESNGGLTMKAVSKMQNGNSPVRGLGYHAVREYYQDKFPQGTNYIYGIDRRKTGVTIPFFRFLGEAVNTYKVNLVEDGVAASALVKVVPIPWNSIMGWWIIGPGYDPTIFHKKSDGFRLPYQHEM